ncbi:MAG: precorrin-3B C(17)-methyltransferase [Geminocystis sp.]|nr:precorrin-3B C(17)-methyltransferase [Geminocystis sp.]MCS7146817.1 precorrin-3B C(17)-methyltransferase [Geminocystis sp.]MDW8115643.1 precorrin-3B C(17)-methyltransferase [Geminocystis sp.]MDW8463186.1 precorrin-3B C(17)-methyltransferase [Geminocystis sp.]
MEKLAIVTLNERGLQTAGRIKRGIEDALIYGLASGCQEADVLYEDFSQLVRELFSQGVGIIGICTTDILIRAVTPLLHDNWQESPVIAVGEDGGVIVPLLGKMETVKGIARQIGEVLRGMAAKPTSGETWLGRGRGNVDEVEGNRGKVTLVGIGPGSTALLTPQALQALLSATDWVGYNRYLDLVEYLRKPETVCHASDNRQELERAKMALQLAEKGKRVALISGGDVGIYGMAATLFEVIEKNPGKWEGVDIEIASGISAMQVAAALTGAPLGHDFCVISLSNLLKPWDIIAQRIELAARGDFVIVFYNPVSKQRRWQLDKAKEILLKWRLPHTPVILGHNLTREGEKIEIIKLIDLNGQAADMNTTIIVGSSQTRIVRRGGKQWVYTPRQYPGV